MVEVDHRSDGDAGAIEWSRCSPTDPPLARHAVAGCRGGHRRRLAARRRSIAARRRHRARVCACDDHDRAGRNPAAGPSSSIDPIGAGSRRSIGSSVPAIWTQALSDSKPTPAIAGLAEGHVIRECIASGADPVTTASQMLRAMTPPRCPREPRHRRHQCGCRWHVGGDAVAETAVETRITQRRRGNDGADRRAGRRPVRSPTWRTRASPSCAWRSGNQTTPRSPTP